MQDFVTASPFLAAAEAIVIAGSISVFVNLLIKDARAVSFDLDTRTRMPPDAIKACSRMATLAYTQGKESEAEWERELFGRLQKAVPQYDFDKGQFRVLRSSGVEAFVAITKDGKAAFVSVRGTQGLYDVITDIRIFPWPVSDEGWGHAGFHHSASKLYFGLRLLEVMQEFRDARWYGTGHSYGAGVIQALILLTSQAKGKGPEFDGALLMCAPRFASRGLAKRLFKTFGRRVIRVSHGVDIVPFLPPKVLGFSHFSLENYIDREGLLHVEVSTMFRVIDFAATMYSNVKNLTVIDSILGSHSCQEVDNHIWENADRF